jgi:hypothetical protein
MMAVKSLKRCRQQRLKWPKHDQAGCEFFYIKQTRMVRGLAKKIIFIFIWGRYLPFCIFGEC